MLKKILLSSIAIAAVIGGIAAFSAYEAHVINVTAHIENALSVTTEAIDFGTVFPQEYVEEDIEITLSSSFLAEDNADDVDYIIKQKPKPYWPKPQECLEEYQTEEEARAYCHANPGNLGCCYLSLCPFLSKEDADPEDQNDVGVPSYYQGDHCVFPDPDYAIGRLAKSEGDETDIWTIDLKVPPVDGYIGQDWPLDCPTIPVDSQDYGCDLWIEVTGISRVEFLDLENKDQNWQIILGDDTYGILTYTPEYHTFSGKVEAYGLETNAKYQITLNGPGICTATDDQLAIAGNNAFESGYWNGGPNLDPNCVNELYKGEGIYNMSLVNNEYTVMTDDNGDFTYSFNLNNLPSGDYVGVKVLVKKTIEPYASPWIDPATIHTTNLFETAPISFTILP